MKRVLVIGAINIDIVSYPNNKIVLYDKNPGISKVSFGGVGRNICESLARLNTNPTLLTIVGNDILGESAINYLKDLNVDILYKKSKLPTSTFTSVLDEKRDNYLSVSSMDIINDFDFKLIDSVDFDLFDIVVSDANSEEVSKYISKRCKCLYVDATSAAKVCNIKTILEDISFLKCTLEEYKMLFKDLQVDEVIKRFPNLTLIITDKDKCVTYNIGDVLYNKDVSKVEVVNAIGAGDSFSAGFVYGLARGYSIHRCIEIALAVAAHTVGTEDTVSKNLTRKVIGE